MLTYDLNERGKTPLYQYLYQRIRDDILAGRIAPHEKLPSKRSLADHLHTSVITVQNAYQLLLAEGYVYSKEKVGFFAEEIHHRPLPGRKPPRTYAMGNTEHAYFADFSSNKVQSGLFPVSTMAKIMREMISLNEPGFLDTVPYNGTEIFRHAIADYLLRFRGMEVDPQQIVVGCGTEYLYSRLMQLFPKDTVLGLEDPGNHKFAKIAAGSGIRSEYLPIDHEGVKLHELERSNVNLLHLSPANSFPRGSVMPARKRFEVLDWLYAEDGRYLIEDDFDSEITTFGAMAMPLFHSDTRERTIYLNTFSKTMLPSLRVAYLVLPAPLVERYRETMTFYSCTVSGSDQYIFARFIADGHFERHLNHMNNHFRAERAQVEEEIAKCGIDQVASVVEPAAGTHVLLALDDTGVSHGQMKANARAMDIRFAFMSDYAANPAPDMRRYLVLNYASVPPDRLHDAMQRLKLCITQDQVAPLP